MRGWRWIASLALLLGSAGACGGGAEEDAEGPLKVGVLVDLSGQTRSYGQATVNGIRMAAEEIGAAGGPAVELVIEDDGGVPDRARAAAEKLLAAGVHVLIGSTNSGTTLAAAPAAEAAKIPIVTPTATNPEVTKIGEHVFRICFVDSFQGEVMANFAHASLRARRAALLVDRDSPYSRGLAQFFEGEFLKFGGETVAEETYAENDEDFTAQLAAVKAAQPDVLFVPGYYAQAGLIAKQARAAGIAIPLLGGDGWDAPEIWQIGGDALNRSFISSHFSSQAPGAAVEKFVADYKTRHDGQAPDAFAALGYDAMKLVAAARERAKGTSPAKLRNAIARTFNFPGVTGEITINRERNALKDAVVIELVDGQSVYRATMSPLLM